MSAFHYFEFNSFWNIWYWGAVVVTWSITCHFILGVPYDMVVRASREGGTWQEQCEALIQAQVFRLTQIFGSHGYAITCVVCFFLAGLGTFAFILDVEAAKAFFVLLTPLTLVHGLSVNLAFRLKREELHGKALWDAIGWQRFWTQIIGLLAIIVVTGFAIFEAAKNVNPIGSTPF